MKNSITWKIGGEAGFGIMSSGIMLSRIFSRLGYHVFSLNEYPSLIRGGHNLITVRVSTEKFFALNRDIDIIVALNKQSVELHMNELNKNTVVVFDPGDYDWKKSDFSTQPILLPVPLTEINKSHGGELVMRNTIAIGATLAILGIEFRQMEMIIKEQFKRKGDQVIDHNIKVAQNGYDYVVKNYPDKSLYLNKAQHQNPKLIINGSEALGLAAVRSGLKFAAVYPMTPINSVITYLATHEKEFNLVYKQPEDEIAGINMAIGASVAGARSMVATSGGGFALMVEGLSLSGMIETPLVIDLGMRVGPATGMPTWSEQGELKFVISAGHGEFARIVLAPGDAEEIFDLTVEAFNLADRFQIPVFILTDKYLNESNWCVDKDYYARKVDIDRGKLIQAADIKDSTDFKRYNLDTNDGVSPRSLPGTKNGWFAANSYEHDEHGLVTEDGKLRTQMSQKRLKKFEAISKIVPEPKFFGDRDSQTILIGWGTTKGPILEAMKILKNQGHKIGYMHFSWLYPFPGDAVHKMLDGKRVIDIENNGTGQLVSLVSEFSQIKITEKILKFDGRPFYPEEIVERIKL